MTKPGLVARLRAGLGLVGILGALAAVPVVLTTLGSLPTAGAISAAVALRALPAPLALGIAAAIGWVAYAYLVGWAIADVAYGLRHRAAPPARLHPPGWAQPVTAHLAALALVVLGRLALPAGGIDHAPPPPAVAGPGPLAVAEVHTSLAEHHLVVPGDNLWDLAEDYYGRGSEWRRIWEANLTAVPDPRELAVGVDLVIPPATDEVGPASYEVRPGDTLSSIAADEMGSAQDWPELWEANRDRPEPDGQSLVDPSLIRPGWTVDLSTGSEPDPPSQGPGRAQPESMPGPTTVEVPPTAASPAPSVGAIPSSSDAGVEEPSSVPGQPGPPQEAPGSAIELPGGYLVSAGLGLAIGAALAQVRLRRRRRRLPGQPRAVISRHEPLLTRTVARLHLGAVDPSADGEGQSVSAGPDVPGLELGDVAVGQREGTELRVCLLGGLVVGGDDGVSAVARAVVIHLLYQPPQEAHVVIAGPSLATELLGRDQDMGGLTVVGEMVTALRILEVELVRRRRVLDQLELSSGPELARSHPEERFTTTVLVAGDVPVDLAGRLGALLAAGRELGFGALLLGEGSGQARIEIGPGPVITSAVPADGALAGSDGAALYHLGADEAAEIVATLAAARGTEAVADLDEEDLSVPPEPSQPRLLVQVLGGYRIATSTGAEVVGLRDKAAELLAYLLLNPDGVPVERAIETLWAEVEPSVGRKRFRTVLSNLRTTLGDALGPDQAVPVERNGEVCRLDPSAIDCDLWSFERALETAVGTADPAERTAALRSAADAYRGDLADGTYYPWIDPAREKLRDQAVNTLVELAQTAGDDVREAVPFLEHAFDLDPYGEEVARRLMRAHAESGNPDAARRAYDRLARVLGDDLDVDPSPETTALLRELLAGAAVSARSGVTANR